MLIILRSLAVAGAIAGAITFLFFAPGFRGGANLLLFWAMAPLPLAWWLSRYCAKTPLALKVVVAGCALALAFALWAYGGAIYVTVTGRESLAGLVVIFAPMIQFAILAVALIAAAIRSARH